MFTVKNSSFEALHQSSLISFTPSWCELLFLFDFWSARDYLFCLPLHPQQNAATAWIGHRSIAQRRTFMNSGVQEWYVINLCFGVPQVGWGKQVYLLYMTKLEKSMMHSFYKSNSSCYGSYHRYHRCSHQFHPPGLRLNIQGGGSSNCPVANVLRWVCLILQISVMVPGHAILCQSLRKSMGTIEVKCTWNKFGADWADIWLTGMPNHRDFIWWKIMWHVYIHIYIYI